MNNKMVLVLSSLFLVTFCNQKPEHHVRAQYLTDRIFGHAGAQLKYSYQESIRALLQKLLIASDYQLLAAAQKAAQLLQQDGQDKQKQLEEEPYNKAVATALFVIDVQKAHLKNYLQQALQNMHWFNYIIFKIKYWVNWDKDAVQEIAQLLDEYCRIEQEHLFTDYAKAVTFLAVQENYKLPKIMTFFEEPVLRKAVLEMVKKSESVVVVQGGLGLDFIEEGGAVIFEDTLKTEGADTTVAMVEKDTMATAKEAENIAGSASTETVESDVTGAIKDAEAGEGAEVTEESDETAVDNIEKEFLSDAEGGTAQEAGEAAGGEGSSAGENAPEQTPEELAKNIKRVKQLEQKVKDLQKQLEDAKNGVKHYRGAGERWADNPGKVADELAAAERRLARAQANLEGASEEQIAQAEEAAEKAAGDEAGEVTDEESAAAQERIESYKTAKAKLDSAQKEVKLMEEKFAQAQEGTASNIDSQESQIAHWGDRLNWAKKALSDARAGLDKIEDDMTEEEIEQADSELVRGASSQEGEPGDFSDQEGYSEKLNNYKNAKGSSEEANEKLESAQEQLKKAEEAYKKKPNFKNNMARKLAARKVARAEQEAQAAEEALTKAGGELEDEGFEGELEDIKANPAKKLTAAERKAEYLKDMQDERVAQHEAEEDILNDPLAKARTKKWIKFKRLFRRSDPTKDNFLDQINAGYKAYIYDNLIAPLEDNALHTALESLPGWLRAPADMMIQMSMMSGGGMVITWISQEDEEVYEQYSALQTKMNATFTSIRTQVSTQVAKKMQAINTALKKQLTSISQMAQNQYSNYSQRNLYISQAIGYVPPVQNFMVEGSDNQTVMQIDQMFAQSALFTPDCVSQELQQLIPTLGQWHDVFQSGNWIYYYPINGFYQTQQVEISGTNSLEKGAQVLYNTIFRDYVPQKVDSYTIQVQCTLMNYAPDFFLGVVFNNARWISGVPDRFHQHRFAGIFGSGGKIYQVCEESVNNTEGTKPNTAWPAYQIINNVKNYAVAENEIAVTTTPFIFTLTITTTPATVTVQIAMPKTSNPLPKLQKKQLNALVFNYHGIGLTSAGCAAQFKIIQPQELTYTSQQVNNFATLANQNQEAAA